MSDVTLNRRMLLAGAATATLAVPAILSGIRPARAAAPMLGAASPAFHRIKLGGFEVTTIRDAARAMDGPHPIFGENQEPGAVAELMQANNLPADKMVNGFTPVVVNTGRELVLFDTGLGGDNGQLAAQLEAAGYSTDAIDIVVLTHMHGDHIGGLMKDGAPVFANARYVTGQGEYDFWSADARLGTPAERGAMLVRSNVVPLAEKTTFLGDGGTVVSGITGLDTSGHTPGHMSYMIESGGKQLMIWGDVANHFVASIQKPEWHVRFDMDKDKAVATRKRIFDMAATDGLAITGYHMPFPALGYVEKVGDGYRWAPAAYQFAL